MRASSINSYIFQNVVMLSVVVLLTGCQMPTEPEGKSLGSMTLLGDQLRERGDDAGAADFYQRALQRNAKDTKARKSLAELFEKYGDSVHALEQYKELSLQDPENAEFFRAIGRLQIKQGQPVPAKEAYDKALSIDSKDVKALNGLGITLDYMGNHVAAQHAYKEVLEEKPDDLAAKNNLAHSYVLVGAYEEAIKLLEPHVQDKEATPALRQNLAEAYGLAGMSADAERVARMDLSEADVKHNLSYFKASRAKLSLEPKFYADLGSFATEAMGEARIEDLKAKLGNETDGLIIKNKSNVKAIGGIPSFSVTVSGFVKADKVKAFCERLKKENIPCKPHV